MDSSKRHLAQPRHLSPRPAPAQLWAEPANDTDEAPVLVVEPPPASGSREVLRLTPADERLAAELLQSFMAKVLGAGG